MAVFFLDTYAMAAIIKGSENYASLSYGHSYYTAHYNLAELYYTLRRDGMSIKQARAEFEKFSQFIIDASYETLQAAMEFKLENKRLNLSYADCIGYICALNNSMKFLTGDEQFRRFGNVEFVKE